MFDAREKACLASNCEPRTSGSSRRNELFSLRETRQAASEMAHDSLRNRDVIRSTAPPWFSFTLCFPCLLYCSEEERIGAYPQPLVPPSPCGVLVSRSSSLEELACSEEPPFGLSLPLSRRVRINERCARRYFYFPYLVLRVLAYRETRKRLHYRKSVVVAVVGLASRHR